MALEKATYPIGAYIFREGDAGEHAYLIKSGEVKITKAGGDEIPRTIATVKAGNIIGEMALIDDKPRVASAVALDQTDVLIITKEEFQQRIKTSDQVIGLLLQTFTARLREQADRLASLTG